MPPKNYRYTTHSKLYSPTLSQYVPPVATTPTRNWLISWNQPKIIIPLHQSFESYVCSFFIFVLGYWLVM